MIFRPSKSGYWSKCAAYVSFTHDLPETDNDATREGICAAWVAQVVLASTEGIACDDMVGKTHANGWLVSDEMARDVQDYVDLVRSFDGQITVEEHVIASASPVIQGTLDTSVYHPDTGILRIVDLKYGRRLVETTAAQLICYAWGKFSDRQPIREIHLSIYQPRGFHRDGIFRTRVITPDQLYVEFTALWNMAVEGEKPNPLATPGPHCRDCEAAAGCEALAHTTYNLVETVMSRHQRDMTAQELSRELDFMDEAKKTIKARFEAIETEAESRLKRETIPGWGILPRKGNRKFIVSGETVHVVTGVDPWEKTICTPKELERRGVTNEKLLNLITTTPVIGNKISRVTSEDIARVFNEATKGK